MARFDPIDLGAGRMLLDLGFRDHDGLIASYLVPGSAGWTLVETGPTTCRDRLLAGLGRAGVAPDEVVRVIVSHIHLDHAGGLGALADSLPNARLVAHERGVRHLVDPTRLVASARRAWGTAADPLWGPIVPVPADRIDAVRGGETYAVAGGSIHVVATPGHASHHVSLFDEATRSMMTGDAAGVHVAGLWRTRPAIPPPDLDLAQLYASLDAMIALEPRSIWFAHFGPVDGATAELRSYRATVEEWAEVARAPARSGRSVAEVAAVLAEHERERALAAGRPVPSEERGGLISGFELAAQGLLRYFETHPEPGG